MKNKSLQSSLLRIGIFVLILGSSFFKVPNVFTEMAEEPLMVTGGGSYKEEAILLSDDLGMGEMAGEMLPPVRAINAETKQCADFFMGDECTSCVLPEGWEEIRTEVCPPGYAALEGDPFCQSTKGQFCCTDEHSGSDGDCEDLVINNDQKLCTFVEDINKCESLPDRWTAAPNDGRFLGSSCPSKGYIWLSEYLECETEKVILEEVN